jgi:hypothetical protein
MSVPVTVKLSELFYRKLGHEVVDEMVNWFNQVDDTYRGQLRELNELNFSRFDAKLEQRLAHLEGQLEQRLAQFDAKWEQRFARLEVKLEAQGRMLLKWMVGLWMATVTTLGGLIVGLLHFARP